MTSPEKPIRVSVVAVMPGTKNGMTLMTQRIVDELRDRYRVRLCDVGRGYKKSNRIWLAKKAIQSIFSGLRIACWKANSGEYLYIPINSNAGLLYNAWQGVFARLRGFRVVVHHHGWSYLYGHDRRMAWLIRILGSQAVHVVACPEMLHELKTIYGTKFESAFVTPGIVGIDSDEATSLTKSEIQGRPLRLGMLSNLMITKGVGEAIDTFEEMRRRGADVELHLGGPIRGADAEERIAEAIARSEGRIIHHGPVYGDDKKAFYENLDVFLFPTLYRNESWGIVLNEALMAGVPVMTYRRGCTGYVVGGDGGLVIQRDENFAKLSSDLMEQWIANPDAYQVARHSAYRRGQELREEAEHQLSLFIDAFENGNWPVMPPCEQGIVPLQSVAARS
ncbi:glycosyltransferase family 4 protein [Rubripirellula amarantea]|nr:glycosyltransferase family 4 protein [Rubripirellula amarantea]